jgi:type III secretion system FlhB-like substrate exporter
MLVLLRSIIGVVQAAHGGGSTTHRGTGCSLPTFAFFGASEAIDTMGLFRKKNAIDPVDFLVLQNEIAQLKERLDASEQSKALLEDQLSSLAATTMVLSTNNRTDASDIVDQLDVIQRRLDASEVVGTKVDALHRRVIDVETRQATAVDQDQIAQLALFRPANGKAHEMDQALITQLAERLEQVAHLAASPAQPDEELAARLLQLEHTATSVESLNRQVAVLTTTLSAQTVVAEQLGQLTERVEQVAALAEAPVQLDESFTERLLLLEDNARQTEMLHHQFVQLSERIAAHAEMSDHLAALNDRIAELESQPAQAPATPAGTDPELLERLAITEAEAHQARLLAGQIEQRLGHMGTELTNQLGELSREIDGLATRQPSGPALSDATVESLRAGQVKLAAEQARHEISFREDLAAIAEQLRQLRTRA